MEIILVLLIMAVLNGAVAYIDEMLQELVQEDGGGQSSARHFMPTGICWWQTVGAW